VSLCILPATGESFFGIPPDSNSEFVWRPNIHSFSLLFIRNKTGIMGKLILMTAALLLATAVATGAFGAHALKTHLSAEMLQTWKTAVDYHFYHALGLLLVGVLWFYMPSTLLKWSAIFLAAGIVLFSGSLYSMALSGIKALGAVTPLGGLSFIAGWVLLFIAAWKKV
jgi:uncharacterized membrane protein YgdD (TMEM256/DUF423 family)